MRTLVEVSIDLLDAIDAVCAECPRPPADDGGEEACEKCYVRKLAGMVLEERSDNDE